MSIRNQRIAEQVRAELARLLREEVSDPRIGLLSITRVKVSPDLSTALIFWSPLDVEGETDLEAVADGLESAAGFLRGQLGRSLSLRRTPELSFRFDASIREGTEILSVLRTLPELERDAEPETSSPAHGPEGAGSHGEEA